MEIAYRVEDGMNRREILCTTYQMRNPFIQFHDGVAGELDAHCYFQHAYAASLMNENDSVLDVCCGRGLMIPFLRYGAKNCRAYIGVDICRKNAKWADGFDPRREKEKKDWGFPCVFVESNVASMADPVQSKVAEPIDLIVYTSAIEHMQPDDQRSSLAECRKIIADGGQLYLSCPVTEKGKSGWDTQYRAHIYEPTRAEIEGWLDGSGFKIAYNYGLCTSMSAIKRLSENQKRQADYFLKVMPRLQALTTIPAMFPHIATEMAFVCHPV